MVGDYFKDMMNCIHQFLTRICESHLCLSAKKSEFFQMVIIFAGSRVGSNGVEPNSTKQTAVIDWWQPPDLLNLSPFLRLTGYFCNLVKNYARITQPLSDLIYGVNIPKGASKTTYCATLSKVKLTNIWTQAHAMAFLNLRKVLTSAPVLKAPHFDGILCIVTPGGCEDRFRGMLAQQFKLVPVTRLSKSCSPSPTHPNEPPHWKLIPTPPIGVCST